MFYFPDPQTKDPKKRKWQRRLEVIPGILTWFTLIGMFLFSYLFPIYMAIFIIAFDIYWIYRTIFITYYSTIGFRKLKEGEKVDWWERCQNIMHPEKYAAMLSKRITEMKQSLAEGGIKFREKRMLKKEIVRQETCLGEVRVLEKIKDQIWDWREIVHVVSLVTANEPSEVIEPAIRAVADSNFPNSQIIILLGTEEREPEERRLAKVDYLKNKFKGVFRDFIVTTHEVSGNEMKAKASNATYAARRLKKYLSEREIDFKKVIFSNFDCDSVAHPQYFAALTYQYIIDPKRLQRSYQPIPMYHNNLWDTNAFVRVIVTSSSFWHIFQSTRPEGMVTFSSHSEPFDTLVKVDFWPVNMISEDSIIYWKCYTYYNGDYKVKPIYLPISLDAVQANTYWKTIVNQYKQKRRWAYGIENFPVIMRAIVPNKKISFRKKFKVGFEMLEGHHSWATASMILAVLGWLPLIFGGDQFNQSVLAHNLPFLTRYLMDLAMTGLIVSMSLSFLLMPPKPAKYSKWRYTYMLLQWVLVPITAPLLGSLPSIDSQTRIMFGKYFGEFWVTDKMRK
ncbi:MAG: glycosyltransferase family 2 protein [Candidatus Pacebacteria bacterium]|nr:glycosyltransferase family 2 protein [Candidatus Paceibacterota bacterium]MDR3583448.1 glycosyltransferase family 2 protein [Candidatus Paceibacterota bacterium]